MIDQIVGAVVTLIIVWAVFGHDVMNSFGNVSVKWPSKKKTRKTRVVSSLSQEQSEYIRLYVRQNPQKCRQALVDAGFDVKSEDEINEAYQEIEKYLNGNRS